MFESFKWKRVDYLFMAIIKYSYCGDYMTLLGKKIQNMAQFLLCTTLEQCAHISTRLQRKKMSASCHQRQVHAAEVCIRRRHSKRDHQSFQQMTWPEKSPICRRSPQHQLCPGECRCGWVAHSSMLWCHRRHSSCSSGPDSAISTTRGQFDHGAAKMPDHREHCRYPMGM